MTDKDAEEGGWFRPKPYGYGAGLPIAWQGWVLLGGYISVMAICGLVIELYRDEGATFGIPAMILATLVFVALVATKTRGGMRWRWGSKDKDK